MYMTISEASEYTHLSPMTLRRYISDGTLKAYRRGKKLVIIDVADLDELIKPVS